MNHDHKKCCRECPFRRQGAPGWLGPYDSPEELLGLVMADVPFPCHLTMPGDDEDEDEDHEESYCHGALAFFSNIYKLSRDRNRPRVPKDEAVFSSPNEFIAFHRNQEKP